MIFKISRLNLLKVTNSIWFLINIVIDNITIVKFISNDFERD
jgi:hypothetical protein